MAERSQLIDVALRWKGQGFPPADEGKSSLFTGQPEVPLTDDDIKSARWTALDQAIAWLGSEYFALMGPEVEEGPERFAAAVPGLTIFDLLRWWPIITAFIAFVQRAQALPVGESVTSPELPFPVPFSGKTFGLSLNVKALS